MGREEVACEDVEGGGEEEAIGGRVGAAEGGRRSALRPTRMTGTEGPQRERTSSFH